MSRPYIIKCEVMDMVRGSREPKSFNLDIFPDYSKRIIEEYSSRNNIGEYDALIELIEKGFRYYEFEKLYGKDIHDREVWDKRFYYLEIESRYLHYKLRLKEVIEELKSLVLTLSKVVNRLELCYKKFLDNQEVINSELNELSKVKSLLQYYLNSYVIKVEKDLRESFGKNDEYVLKSILETVDKYKKMFGVG